MIDQAAIVGAVVLAIVALGGFVGMLYKVFSLFSDMNVNIKLLNQNFTHMNSLFSEKFEEVERRIGAHGEEIDAAMIMLEGHDKRISFLEGRN